MARLLWHRRCAPLDRLLLPYPDAQLRAVPEGRHQASVAFSRVLIGLWRGTHGVVAGRVPYWLVVKRYWKTLIGTCGAWLALIHLGLLRH